MTNLQGYSITGTVYQGSGTIVYRGVRNSDGLPIICKVLNIDYPSVTDLSSFRREYELGAKLQGNGTVQVYGLENPNNTLAIVMEDFGGEALSQSIGLKSLGIAERLLVATRSAEALAQIHRMNIIHKDLTPSNILRNPKTGAVKIIDFAIATELSRETAACLGPGVMEGCLAYISPEQTGRMNRPIDLRTDLYSLGATLWELFTGRPPFTTDDNLELVYCHLAKLPASPRTINPEIPETVAAIILKLLSKAPEDRYQSATGLLRDLRRCLEELTAKGSVDPFPIGQFDGTDRFAVPNRLYGRDDEIAMLRQALRDTADGDSKLLLLAGAPGTGKTSLIREMHKSISGSKGFLISGKCGQLERNIPYNALLQAFRDLIDQLLCGPSELLGSCRHALSTALGPNAAALVELLPKLADILGPQDPPARLDPVAAQNRLQLAIREFISVFARPGHPVMIFLDDLQWSDIPTLDLVRYLLGGSGIPGLLLVGAYRDTEVRDADPLAALLNTLDDRAQQAGMHCQRIVLEPLGTEVLNRMLADTLRCPPEDVRQLTSIVHKRTDGNPFFTNQMLGALYAQGAFTYNAADDCWRCDLNRVLEAKSTDNVIDLLVRKIESFSSDTKTVLRIAACIGNTFDLRTISAVSGQSIGTLARCLWEAIEREVIIPLNPNYRLLNLQQGDLDISAIDIAFKFQHDRLLQAVCSTIPEQDVIAIHHSIGQEMLRAFRAARSEGDVFELVSHLNIAKARIRDQAARLELADLNAMAGRKALLSTAFKSAAEYFETSISLLPTEAGQGMAEQRFSLSLQQAESLFLAGELPRADQLAGALFPLATGSLDRAAAHKLTSRICESQGNLLGAIDEIRKGLALLGFALPERQEEIQQRVGEGLGGLQQGFARVPIDALANLPALVDPEKVMAMRLLAQVVPAAIQSNYALYMVATMMMMELTLTHGVTAESCKCIADCGIIYSAVLGDYETGYRLGRAGFALIEKLKVDWQRPPVCFSFTYVSHMRKHYQEGLDYYEMSYRTGMEVGDMQHAMYARSHKVHLMTWVGANLGKCRQETERTITFLREFQGLVQLMLADIVLHAIKQLSTLPDPQEIREFEQKDGEILATIERTHNVVLLGRFSQYNAFLHYLLGDHKAAARWSATAESVIFAAGTDFPIADHYLVQALLCLTELKSGMVDGREAALEKVARNLAILKKLSDNCPENFAHKYYLVAAQLSDVNGEPVDTTMGFYQKALDSIREGQFPQMAGLINESHGMFWLGRDNETIGRALLRQAYFHYGQWGSVRKLAAMEERHPGYFPLRSKPTGSAGTHRSTGHGQPISNEALDITSIIKSTQAISSEIKTERLLNILLQTIIENAGAQNGCFLLSHGPYAELSIEALKQSDSDAIEIRSLPYTESSNLCQEVVRFVERTRESVVLNDAAVEGNFRSNAYIKERAIKSVLCMPVIHQNALKGIVYLENNLSDHVFTTERLNILKILASQASISIENARLYENMESKVRERTLLLNQANEKLKELALIDPLTRLNNRRYFYDHITGITEAYIRKLHRCITKAEQRNTSLLETVMGVFLVDIDHFKEVNDTWGHAAGDNVLVAISRALRSLIRADDFIVRWGGEEFLVILNNTDPRYLDRFARKVLSLVRQTGVKVAEDEVIDRTCSIGYTQVPFSVVVPDFLTLEQTIKLSDYAMYVAKRNGRNRAVRISIEEGQKPDEAVRECLRALSRSSEADTGCISLKQVFEVE